MKKVVVFALIAALCAGALLYFYLGKIEQQHEVKVEYESVVVAAVNIPAYTPITTEMVTLSQVPLGSSHPLAAHTLEEVIGYVTENDIIAGEQILPVKLKQLGESDSGLSYIVPDGMRAVTIAVDEVTGVAGFLQRGDYVDVISYITTSYEPTTETQDLTQASQSDQAALAGETDLTAATEQPVQTGEGSQSTTLIAAQNVRIAALGTSLANGTSGAAEGAVGYNTITLFLTPEQAMRVVHAARSGAIVIILRASGDHADNTEVPIINNMLLEKAK